MTREQLQMHLILRGLDQSQVRDAFTAIESVPGRPQPVYFPLRGESKVYVYREGDYAEEVPG